MNCCSQCGRPLRDAAAEECDLCRIARGVIDRPMIIDDRFQVDSVIGRGEQGTVLLARDNQRGGRVAVKLMHTFLAGDPDSVARVQREASALGSVRSDHVAKLHAFGTHEGTFFLAMEFVDGVNLGTLLEEHAQRGEFMPTYRAITILRQVAEGLADLHGAGIVHRDIKPSNILIERGTGRPVILDLGLARWFAKHAQSKLSLVGTPAYMAPEQILGDEPGRLAGHTDVYSLGCTAFELFTGRPPFMGSTSHTLYQQMCESAPSLSSIRPELHALDDVVTRAIAKDPGERFATCALFIAALDEAGREWPRPPSRPDAKTVAAPPSMRVMIVDDDEMFLAIAAGACQMAMRTAKFETSFASSGLEGLRIAEEAAPDLVILDFDMPLLNGLETLSHLRALPAGRRSQVVVVSAAGNDLPRWRFASLGVTDFVRKPVKLQEFVSVLGDAAKRALEVRAAGVA